MAEINQTQPNSETRWKWRKREKKKGKEPKKQREPYQGDNKFRLFFEKYLRNAFVLSVILALLLNLAIEVISRHSFWKFMDYFLASPMTFFYNSIIILATLSIAFIIKRRIFVYTLVSVFWLGLGITNGVILATRTTPFTVTDLSLADAGLSLVTNYLNTGEIIAVFAGAVLIIVVLVASFIIATKNKSRVKYKKAVLGLVVLAFVTVGATEVAINSGWVSTYFGNLNYAYRDYGFPYCFVNTWLNTGIRPPKNYSEKEILGIMKPDELPVNQVPGDQTVNAATTKDMPNILMLQLESFFDPTHVKGLTFSKDPIPYFRSLKKNYSSGFLTVPAFGAGTANTEFECLSGMSVRFFGPGEYPYKSILLKKTCETICYDLKNLGYGTHAIHNHRGAFYGRNKVFPNLGFDTFTSLEYMNNVTKTPKNWAKDGVLTGEIKSALDSTKGKDFIYTVSVQGHGQYPTNKVLENPAITVSGLKTEAETNAFEYYLQEINEMDTFVQQLTTMLSNYPEKVVLVMYGDHLPGLGFTDDMLDNGNVYQTEYVIWSNFPLKKQDKDLNSYQLNAEVLNRLGIHEGLLTKYHQNHQKDKNYLENLKALQYDMLYGKEYIYGQKNPFAPTNMKMGVNDIVVDNVVKIGKNYFIRGKNFTPYSKISMDGKVLDTIFLGPTILGLLDKVDPKDVGKMKVSQVEKNNEILSTTE